MTSHRNIDQFNEMIDKGSIKIHRSSLFDCVTVPKPPTFDYERVEGMLLGVAIGDSLGITTEGKLPAYRKQYFGEIKDYLPNKYTGEERGFPSDDTQLSFWTLAQLVDDNEFIPVNVASRLANSGKIFGIGSNVREFLANQKVGKPWYESGPESAGNGALMRISPLLIPHLRTGGTNIWVDICLAAIMTHNDYASTSACLTFSRMLWDIFDMDKAPDNEWWVKRYVEIAKDLEGDTNYSPRGGIFTNYSGPVWRFVEEKVLEANRQNKSVLDACAEWYSGAYLMETVPSVLYILMRHAHEPEEAIIRAINDTKDNDTIASIVGAALGALHGKVGFPSRWIRNLSGRTTLDDEGFVFDLIEKARITFWEKV